MHIAIIQSKDLWLGTILSTLQQDHIALAIRQLCRQHQPCGARADDAHVGIECRVVREPLGVELHAPPVWADRA